MLPSGRAAATISAVLPVLFTWLYRKLGRLYPVTYVTVELQTAFGITLGTLALLSGLVVLMRQLRQRPQTV